MPDPYPGPLTTPSSPAEGSSDDRFRRLIAGLHVGVVVQGPASEILILNAAALELLGVTEEQILGKTSFDPYWKITHEDGSEFAASERPVATVLATRQRVSNVVIGVHRPRQRDQVWLLINAEPELAADGSVSQVVATLADITEHKRLEASLLQARKLESIGRLAGGIAHDFNNLLTVIIGSTSLALASLAESAPERVELSQSLEAAERAASLTKQLLTFARRQVTIPTCVDLAEALRSLEPLLARLIGEHIELRVLTNAETWSVDIDPVQLEQVIVNLAVNARDAMPHGGKLVIELGKTSVDLPHGEYATLRVSDTGHGMDAETRDHLFEPFFSTKELGTGLGLATVYGVVEHHGGFVTVQSEPGRGATFTVHLKRSTQRPLRAPTPSSTPEPTSGKGTILVIEDEPLVRNLAQTVLAKHGYEVLIAGDGLEAIARAQAHLGPIHVVVTDVVMPKLDGNRTAAQLKVQRPELVVLFTSGYTEHGISFAEGRFLAKPYTPSQLLERVRAALKLSAERRGSVP
jgi:PAS domain S-box-containing protein